MPRVNCICGQSIDVAAQPTFNCPKCRAEHHAILPPSQSPEIGFLIAKINEPQTLTFWLGGHAQIPIGKLADNPICLPGAKVSRHHAKLVRNDGSNWKIVDLKSTNGLFVNKTRVAEHLLKPNDVVLIGEYALKCISPTPQEFVELPDPDSAPDIVDLPDPDSSIKLIDLPEPDAAPDIVDLPEPDDLELAPEPKYIPPPARHYSPEHEQPAFIPGGPTCPSCKQQLTYKAKVCVACGIHVPSGRPLITSQGIDEYTLYENTHSILAVVSFLVPFSPIPTPLVSEAYGSHKPWTNRIFAAITILTSLLFFFATYFDEESSANRFMLWPKNTQAQVQPQSIEQNPDFQEAVQKILVAYRDTTDNSTETEFLRAQIGANIQRLRRTVPQNEIEQKAVEIFVRENFGEFFEPQPKLDYQHYQLVTSAFIHDNSDPLNFLMHLCGNLVFMFVFGNRVNALLGNILTAVIYPFLAISSALFFQFFAHADGPLLGASGAIFGLAGMYFILFPANRVHCAIWFWPRWFFFRTLFCWVKIFTLRGFWFLLFYFAYNILMAYLDSDANSDNVAYMGHIGGFITGVVIALGILASRQINCGGGDILSVALGKFAWPLIGAPAKRNIQ